MTNKEEITGERLTTSVINENTLEHLHRYAFSCELATGKYVLDIACGEGYGTNLIAKKASRIVGIDIDEKTIDDAKLKYSNSNIQFKVGNITSIPEKDLSFDLIVCFETIEHIEEYDKSLLELKRVLKSNGILLISTPNKEIYSDKSNYINPYHKKEFNKDQFETLILKYFKYTYFLQQSASFNSILYNKEINTLNFYNGNFKLIDKIKEPEAVYFFAIASDEKLPNISNSVFFGHKVINQEIKETEKIIKSTITYKLGHNLLLPLKLFWKIFRK